jgi:hypothetical protein
MIRLMKKIIVVVIVLSTFGSQFINANGLRASLITCGTGQELYACFGHSGIRIIDSINGTDKIYNYGMFDFDDPNFYSKFVKGTLMYFSDAEPTEQFTYMYQIDKREVKEQVLNMTDAKVLELKTILDNNNLEQNKYYKYDFLFNNCSTKLRDIFEKLYGSQLQFAKVLPDDSLTFMGMLNSYLTTKHAERIGIDVILCSRVNDKMTNRESMFLPEWLSDNFAAAKVNGAPLVAETKILLTDGEVKTKPTNTLAWVFALVSLVLIAISFLVKSNVFWQWFDDILFTILGILGCFFIFMWFGSSHVETKHNLCMLWALPTHLLWLVWRRKKHFGAYCKITLALCLISIAVVHPFVQSVAWEVYPIIALIAVRLTINWRKSLLINK